MMIGASAEDANFSDALFSTNVITVIAATPSAPAVPTILNRRRQWRADCATGSGYLMYSGALATRCTFTAGFFSPAGIKSAVKWFCSGAIWQLK